MLSALCWASWPSRSFCWSLGNEEESLSVLFFYYKIGSNGNISPEVTVGLSGCHHIFTGDRGFSAFAVAATL
jgi:hypothetical protein